MPKLMRDTQPETVDVTQGTIAYLMHTSTHNGVSSAQVRRLTHSGHRYGCLAHTVDEDGAEIRCTGCNAYDEVRARGWFF